jgi:hypothetical protein
MTMATQSLRSVAAPVAPAAADGTLGTALLSAVVGAGVLPEVAPLLGPFTSATQQR